MVRGLLAAPQRLTEAKKAGRRSDKEVSTIERDETLWLRFRVPSSKVAKRTRRYVDGKQKATVNW